MDEVNQLEARPRPRAWASDGLWALAVAVTRAGLAVALGLALKWSDPSDDVTFQMMYAADPGVLLGLSEIEEGRYLPPFPPLLPVVLFLISLPTKLIGGSAGTFLAMRLGYAVLEGLGLWGTRAAMRASGVPGRGLLGASLLWLAMPVGWMSASVICQEESVGVAFAALMVWLVVKQRLGWALVVAGVGVVAGKVYFLVPIAGMVLAGPIDWKTLLTRGACGFGPIAVVYGFAAAMGGGFGLASFTPQVEPSINLFGLVPLVQDVDDGVLKRVSAVPALLLGMLPVVVARFRGGLWSGRVEGVDLVRVITAQWLWVFFSFYLVSPEYFILVVPGVLVSLRGAWSRWAWVLGLLTIPWGTNFAYGVGLALERAGDGPVTGGKAAFVKIWQAVMPIDPVVGHVGGIVVFVLGLGALATLLTASGRATATTSNPYHRG